MKQPLREFEEALIDAWPAAETEDLDGWFMRASGGPSHRANSVATLEAGSQLALEARIARAEAWYEARKRAPMFHVGPCVAPAELDHVLVERGYRKQGEAVVAVASPELVRERCPVLFSARIESKLSDTWLRTALDGGRFASSREVLLGILKRLGSRCRFATSFDAAGTPAAACLAISSEDRLGVYAMFSVPSQRRRGAARALLHALAEAALEERMRELYLLVETANAAARALYAQCGFQDLYRYHYRTLLAGP
jgi:N-acetylglutamate synthase